MGSSIPLMTEQVLSSMTGDEFRSRYQIGERLTQPPVVTHRATDESGAFVLVHYLLGSETVSGASLVKKVESATEGLKERIRDLFEVDGLSVVVTDVLSGFSTLEDWLATGEEESPVEEKEPGAYTQLFRLSEMGLDGPPTPPTQSETPPPPAPPSIPDPTSIPDPPSIPDPTSIPDPPSMDETRSTEHRPPEGTVPPPPGASEEPPPTEEKAPGSYTMLFGKGSTEAPPAPPPPATPTPIAPTPPATPPPPPPPAAPVEPVATPGQAPPPDLPSLPVTPPPPPLQAQKEADGATLGFPPPPSEVSPGPPVGDLVNDVPGTDPKDVPEESSATGFLGQVAEEDRGSDRAEPVFPSLDPPPPSAPADPPPPPSPPSSPPPPPPLLATDKPAGSPPAVEAPRQPDAPPPAKKPDDDGKPGAYTQIFGAMRPAGSTDPKPPVYSPPPASPPSPPIPTHPPVQGGASPEWQRWKDTPGASGDHIPSDDYLSRLSGSPTPGQGPPPPSTPSPAPISGPIISPPPPPGGPSGSSGPGHYTMVREGLTTGSGMGPPPPTASSAPPPPEMDTDLMAKRSTGSKVWPIVGLVAVVLVVVALAVVLTRTG